LSERFDNTLIFNINNSRSLAWILLVVHAGAAGIVLWVPLAAWFQLLALASLAASLHRVFTLHARRTAARAVHSVELESDGDWTLRLKNMQDRGPCRLRARFVHPWLVVLLYNCVARVAGCP
jgi:uncharacterized protein (DUF58 family)